MHPDQIAFVFFVVAAVLGIVAAIVPEASGRLTPLAVAAVALGPGRAGVAVIRRLLAWHSRRAPARNNRWATGGRP